MEPTPGVYSELYLARLEQLVGWAQAQGVSVVIDFHQDNYSQQSHACCADDGAARWAWLVNVSSLTEAQRLEIAPIRARVFVPALLSFFFLFLNRTRDYPPSLPIARG